MEAATRSEQPIISNSYVKCYSDHLVIHIYYFPVGNKTIKYKDIQRCELLPMKDLSILKCKQWGMALSSIWWPLDWHRYSRKYYILLDMNHWPKIGITMDDQDINSVYQLIKQNMNANQSTKISSGKKSFDDIEQLDTNMNDAMSERELEHQKLLESIKAKYPD